MAEIWTSAMFMHLQSGYMMKSHELAFGGNHAFI